MNVLREPIYADPLKRNLWISVALHAGIAAAFAFKAAFIPSEPLLLQSAIRVDVVGMPDKIKTPEPAPAAKPAAPQVAAPAAKPEVKPPPAPTVKKEEKADPKKIKSKQEEALSRLKAQEAIENMRREMAEKEANERAAAKARTFKGNQVASGDSLTGLDQIEHERYLGAVKDRVLGNWNLPAWLRQSELKVLALVRIDGNGNVTTRQVVQTSGNEIFDAQVLEAIDKSSPFPEPPARLKNVLALQGITFGFPE